MVINANMIDNSTQKFTKFTYYPQITWMDQVDKDSISLRTGNRQIEASDRASFIEPDGKHFEMTDSKKSILKI